MTPASQRPRLTPEVFRMLRDLIHANAGLEYHDDALYAFERRLSERLAALSLDSFNDYYQYLRLSRGGAAELEEALDLLTTKETYFFRQEYQLRSLSDEILPALARTNQRSRRLAIWSAGCATGEEVYSVGICVLDSRLFDGWDVRIIGSDLSKKSVAAARRGVYRPSAFRSTAPEVRREYFDERPDGTHVADSVKRLCHFGQLNLLDASRGSIVGRVDLVLCRNVLIYFGTQARARVIENLYERLVPGGYLLLGHSESLWNVSTAFELCHLREDLVYRRPVAARTPGSLLP